MGRRQEKRPQYALSEQDRRAIIVDGNAEVLVREAEKIGRELSRGGLKSAQIRNVFVTVRKIQATWSEGASELTRISARRQLQLLKPKMAYQAARNDPVRPLAEILTPAIDDVGDDRGRFQNLVDFFEAILAYHRAAGGS